MLALWIRSYWINDYATYTIWSNQPGMCEIFGFSSNRGHCCWGSQLCDVPGARGFHYQHRPVFNWTGTLTFGNRLGFVYDSGKNALISGYHFTYIMMHLPHWLLFAVAGLLPAS